MAIDVMTFWRCYYHVIWATSHRAPLISSPIEALIINAVRHKSDELGCTVYAVNTVPDHIHVAVAIPPRLPAADWVRQVKGLTSYEVNSTNPSMAFHWQSGYGILTFGHRNLSFVTRYIENQKIHHANGTSMAYLEAVDDPDDA